MSGVPRLSIGLPVYNGDRYLANALDALLGQSYKDFELIISDNASTDKTPEICRRYEKLDARVRYCRQLRNIGSTPNHNFVVAEARGELFKWASYDDLYREIFLNVASRRLTNTPKLCSPTPGRPTSMVQMLSSPRRRTRLRRTWNGLLSVFGASSSWAVATISMP